MKWLVASDIHGSAYYCRKLLEAFDREGADKLLLLGDILYHGPRNPLPREYDPPQVAQLLNARKDSILCVRGNCDSEVDQMVLDFPIGADTCVICFENKTVYATHGHLFSPDAPLKIKKGDIMLFGHIHVPVFEEKDGFIFVNPGSVSIPKQESDHGYLTLTADTISFKTLDGQCFKTCPLQ